LRPVGVARNDGGDSEEKREERETGHGASGSGRNEAVDGFGLPCPTSERVSPGSVTRIDVAFEKIAATIPASTPTIFSKP
jgi:hypothetical protein